MLALRKGSLHLSRTEHVEFTRQWLMAGKEGVGVMPHGCGCVPRPRAVPRLLCAREKTRGPTRDGVYTPGGASRAPEPRRSVLVLVALQPENEELKREFLLQQQNGLLRMVVVFVLDHNQFLDIQKPCA